MRKGRTRTIKPEGKGRRGNVDFRVELWWINEEVKERRAFGLCFSAASGHSPSVKSFRQHPLLSLANLSRKLARIELCSVSSSIGGFVGKNPLSSLYLIFLFIFLGNPLPHERRKRRSRRKEVKQKDNCLAG
jgi:hypothetical protein